MSKARTIRIGTYKGDNGKVYEVHAMLSTTRKAGWMEICKRAYKRGGRTTAAGGAITITMREMKA